jgi:hypothetical protein
MGEGNIYLHVGLQKTASTYLQEEVFPSIPSLLYVGRPYTQENYAFNSLQYADDALYNSDVLARELQLVRRDAGTRPVLISDEMFSGFAPYGMINRGAIAKRLAEVIPEAEVILFLRGQVDLIESLYKQYIKIGWISCNLGSSFLYRPGKGFPYEKWAEGKRDWNYQNRAFQHRGLLSTNHFLYTKLISMYEALFKRVHVFLYEDLKHNPQDSLERLEDVLASKITHVLSGERKQINAGLNNNAMAQKIFENRLCLAFGSKAGSKLSKILTRLAVPFMSSQTEVERKNYVTKLLRAGGIFKDNKMLNENKNIGMQRYASHYFADE